MAKDIICITRQHHNIYLEDLKKVQNHNRSICIARHYILPTEFLDTKQTCMVSHKCYYVTSSELIN
jgi:hypothetical protein